MFNQAWAVVAENEFPIDVTSGALTTTSGSTIVVGVACNSFNSIADGDVTDNKGNTYTRVATAWTPGGVTVAMFYCVNAIGGSGHTLRFQRGDASQGAICGVELTNMLSSSFDVSKAVNNQTGTTFTTGTTTSTATDTLVGVFTADSAGTWAAGSGYTLRASDDSTGSRIILETQDSFQAGTIEATASKGSSMGYASILAAFKESTGQNIVAAGGSLSLAGSAVFFRVGSTTWLRYRK